MLCSEYPATWLLCSAKEAATCSALFKAVLVAAGGMALWPGAGAEAPEASPLPAPSSLPALLPCTLVAEAIVLGDCGMHA